MVDIYGGEVGLLPKRYWEELITTLNYFGVRDINLISNLSMLNEITQDPRVYTSVSYDFEAREDSDRVWKNMVLLQKPFSILILATPKVLSMDVSYMISMLNTLSNLVTVEIKPYSTNQANQHQVSFKEYGEFVKSWIESPITKNFRLTNEDLLDSVISRERNSFSDDHIYITPEGGFAVLEFDLNDNEYFKTYTSFEEYLNWCDSEKIRVAKNKFCSQCEYYGRCLSEHLREVKALDEGCNGFYHLIKWYEGN
jgi:hypothetical protein